MSASMMGELLEVRYSVHLMATTLGSIAAASISAYRSTPHTHKLSAARQWVCATESRMSGCHAATGETVR
jgi:hypothetical protein